MLCNDFVSRFKKGNEYIINIGSLFNRIQRDQLLKNDFASNVKLLQNYPPMDINIVLAKAVSL